MTVPRHLLAPALALVMGAGLLAPAAATTAPAVLVPVGAATTGGPLTNLDHLDFLGDAVAPPPQQGHTTYRLAEEPEVGVLWTYADRRDGDVFERVGGGPYDAATDTWGQGAYNADDLTRAAVVYLRHWQQTGSTGSRDSAYQLLRGITYLQTVEGPDAGNIVLWMQPDGTLEPSPEPVELPDPSDSAESYWLARTVWSLGEGFAGFAEDDPEFAAFLHDRMDLSLAALERQVLDDYGTYDVADGVRVPAWLVVDGADASAEAVLGLAAFVEAAPAGDPVAARAAVATAQLAEGIAAMSGGDAQQWPYGAIVQWTHSQSFWHAWSSQMPAALAVAAQALDQPDLLPAAVEDAAVFTPHLLTSTGMVNGWLPVPGDLTQIAYGVDSRVQSLVAVADAADRPALDTLAGITASWYFGANRAGEPMYDPATGRTYDGLSAEGAINRNSGAESTIHGLLSMLALDARPEVRDVALSSTSLLQLDGMQVVEAESSTGPGTTLVTPLSAWTGESQWSAGSYLALTGPASVTWSVPIDDQPRFVTPVADLVPDRRSPVVAFRGDRTPLGVLRTGSGGDQGVTEAPGALLPTTLRRTLDPGATSLTATVSRRGGTPARLDALLLKPLVSRLVLDGPEGGTVLLHSAADRRRTVAVDAPGDGDVVVEVHDLTGRLVQRVVGGAGEVSVTVLPSGFTVVTG